MSTTSLTVTCKLFFDMARRHETADMERSTMEGHSTGPLAWTTLDVGSSVTLHVPVGYLPTFPYRRSLLARITIEVFEVMED